MRARVLRAFFCAAFLTLSPCVAWAQATAQMAGVVTDQKGGLAAGVAVKATQTATGAVRSTVSLANGEYTLTDLPIGPYMLEAALPGFSTYVRTGIVLQVGSAPNVNIVLQVGEVTQTVDVKADAAMVETSSTGVGSVVDNARVEDLPLNGRVATQLIFLAGMS